MDWDQVGTSDSLGSVTVDLASLEPMEAREVVLPLNHPKYGQKGEIKLGFVFTPQIVARTRKATSTFAIGQRAMTQVTALPFGAGKGLATGLGAGLGGVGGKARGLFGGGSRTKTIEESDEITGFSIPVPQLPPKENNGRPVTPTNGRPSHGEGPLPELPAGQISQPTAITAAAPNGLFPISNTAAAAGEGTAPREAGTLRVTVLGAKDLSQTTDIKPYASIKVGSKTFQTKHQAKTTSPEWCVFPQFNPY